MHLLVATVSFTYVTGQSLAKYLPLLENMTATVVSRDSR